MSIPTDTRTNHPGTFSEMVSHELEHLGSNWLWFVLLGSLLVAAGTLAIVVPAATVGTTFGVTIFIGVLLMVAGISQIVSSFWIGKWSGFAFQLLVGILYLVAGFATTEKPVAGAISITWFIALAFIIVGAYRTVVALVIRFPQWGWALLNGVITLLAGVVIYRQLPLDAFWVLGLLVGLEMLFNGWTWVMLGMALRGIAHSKK